MGEYTDIKIGSAEHKIPAELADFIISALNSGRYLWVITYLNPITPGRLEHARTINEFPVGDILPSLERHKMDFTEKVIKPHQDGHTALMVDGRSEHVAIKQSQLKVIQMPTPEEIQEARKIKEETEQADKEDDGSWE